MDSGVHGHDCQGFDPGQEEILGGEARCALSLHQGSQSLALTMQNFIYGTLTLDPSSSLVAVEFLNEESQICFGSSEVNLRPADWSWLGRTPTWPGGLGCWVAWVELE